MRPYGSTMLSTRAGKFRISSESNGLVTQPEDYKLMEQDLSLLELEMGRNEALQVMGTGCRLLLVAGPLFMQFLGASFIQGMVSSIPIVGSISPEGFLTPILLLVVIIVTVVIVAVILVVVVVAIVGVVIVVAIIGVVVVFGGVSFIIKLSFVII
ncbi:hypothetical protein Tco_1294338 [Tanacetum coccineum]